MSDYIADTPIVVRYYCPVCEPNADPTAEVLEVRHCAFHPPPSTKGADDDAVTAHSWLSGSTEITGEDNRKWCEFFHRRKG